MSAAESFPPPGFPLVRYRLHSVVERRIAFVDFAGSALRGAFGHALKRAVCVTGLDACAACSLYRTCAYPAVFEPPPTANPNGSAFLPSSPFVIEPPALGAQQYPAQAAFDFDLVLHGEALKHLSLILLAWKAALQDLGAQGRARLVRVATESGEPVLDLTEGKLRTHPQMLIVPAAPVGLNDVTLAFSTPLSFTRDGKPLPPEAFQPAGLLMTLVRRVANVAQATHGQRQLIDFTALRDVAGKIEGQTHWTPHHWQRHSSRQHRKMPMGGVTGTWRLHGNLTPFWPYLYLGQWLHVGKKTSFGLGRYSLHMTA